MASQYDTGPFDVGLVNDDKLIKSLVKQGIIAKDASRAEQQEKMNDYVQKRAEEAKKVADNSPQDVKKARRNMQKMAGLKIAPPGKKAIQSGPAYKQNQQNTKKTTRLDHKIRQWLGIGHKSLGQRQVNVPSIQKQQWQGEVRQDKVLVLLIQYSDFHHNNIKPEDHPVFLYPDFNKEHYKDMIFDEEGYKGPDGQNFISVKQFYDQQSGHSYTLDGDVYGWFTAEHNAAYYGANRSDGNDVRPRELVMEALTDAAASGVQLSDYDQEDPFDLDADGNYREPDGIVDHLMVIHSGVGEEFGGGSLGPDAIWSHKSHLDQPTPIPNTSTDVDYWGGQMAGYNYTAEPEDGAAGVFAHEFAHDLGLPDEYDHSTPFGEPIGLWSLMSAGEWGGIISGTEPTGFGPYDKEFLQSEMPELNWLKGRTVDLDELNGLGTLSILDEASVKGSYADAVRVNLPDKQTVVNEPASGEYEYFSGSGNILDHSMTTTVDLTNMDAAKLTFKAWYDIEKDWDYASVQVKQGDQWVSIPGNLTTTEDPHGNNPGNGITGKSDGWIDANFDLFQYVGQKITLRINYWTDVAVANPGLYVDDLQVTADGQSLLNDGAESADSAFELAGFQRDQGVLFTEQYYLLEWRNWQAADQGLAHIHIGETKSLMSYDPGLVVWYVDKKYGDNIEANHPGHGFLGVVDAHQYIAKWSDGTVASNLYQVQDAAFSLHRTDDMFLDYRDSLGIYLKEPSQQAVPFFNDARDYSPPENPYIGVKLPEYGLKVFVVGESKDRSVSAIYIGKW